MSINNRITGLAGLFVVIMVVFNSGLLNVFAKSELLTEPMDSVKEIVVELHDDYFNPDEITIASGKTTKLQLKNVGEKEHTFTVETLGIDVEIQPGEEETITVTPENTGAYELICRYHQQEGMVGEIIVE